MGSMCLKPWRIQLGCAQFVVEFATVAYAVKQKDGLLLALYIKRLLIILEQKLFYPSVILSIDCVKAKLKYLSLS